MKRFFRSSLKSSPDIYHSNPVSDFTALNEGADSALPGNSRYSRVNHAACFSGVFRFGVNPVRERPRTADPLVIHQSPQPAPVQQVAAQGSYGGGFIEFLFGGGGRRSEPRYDRYPPFPADLGPGVIEAPNQPGGFVMDPRYVRQVVPYAGSEAPGTVIINTQDRMLYLVKDPGRAIVTALA
jgi:hypothetical protein